MSFSPELRGALGERASILDELQALFDEMLALARDEIQIQALGEYLGFEGSVPALPIRIIGFAHTCLIRAIDFSGAIQRNANAFSYAPVWSDCRSLFEVAALLDDCLERMEAFTAAPSTASLKALDEHLEAVVLGFKADAFRPTIPDWPAIQAKNVLTLIDRVTKRFDSFRSSYDLLSEVAHPNYMGLARAYQEVTEGGLIIRFHRRPPERDIYLLWQPLQLAQIPVILISRAVGTIETRLLAFCTEVAKIIPPPVKPPA